MGAESYSHSSNTNEKHSSFWDGCVDFLDAQNQYGFYLRAPNNQWIGINNFLDNALGTKFTSNPVSTTGRVYPYWNRYMQYLLPNDDGSYPLFPCQIRTRDQGTLGEIDGLFAIPGEGLNVEDIIQFSGDDYIVLRNTWYTDDGALIAFRKT